MKTLRRIAIVAIVLVVAGAGVRLAMPFAARRLIRTDRLVHSDMIIVLASCRLERTVEAGVLFREGWSPRIMLLREPDLIRDQVRQQLGIHVPVFLDIQRDALQQMGVPRGDILESPHVQDTTRSEAAAVAEYAKEQGYRRLIIVTSPYHTGRAGSLFDAAASRSFQVIMRPSRYESVDPSVWWRRPSDRTDVVMEYLKTLHGWGQVFNL